MVNGGFPGLLRGFGLRRSAPVPLLTPVDKSVISRIAPRLAAGKLSLALSLGVRLEGGEFGKKCTKIIRCIRAEGLRIKKIRIGNDSNLSLSDPAPGDQAVGTDRAGPAKLPRGH